MSFMCTRFLSAYCRQFFDTAWSMKLLDARLSVCLYIRDVNSREITFPGSRVAIPGSRSRLSILPEYVSITGMIRVGSLAGAWRG